MELCGFSRLRVAPSHAGGLLAAFQYTGSLTSLFCATPREMDPEFRALQERLRALRAEPVPAIIIAARDGDVDALRRELDLGVSVDLADAWKSTPLQVVCGTKELSDAADRRVLVPRRLLLEVASKFYYGLGSSFGRLDANRRANTKNT